MEESLECWVKTGEKKEVIVRCDGASCFFFLTVDGPAGFLCTGVLDKSPCDDDGIAPEGLELW
jgi:hypothetical protein